MPALLQIDAFTAKPFAGNPAAVCLLEYEADPCWMQSVAAEINLSETAFVRPIENGYALRWFTPMVEVDLCGHATLATAAAIWSEQLATEEEPIRFSTRSGWLTATRDAHMIELDFPATPASETEPSDELCDCLGVRPVWYGCNSHDKLLVIASEAELRAMRPDFSRLASLTDRGVIVSSRSEDPAFDFVSRYFAPAAGIDEDPVTGSAHCTLASYWAVVLNKRAMTGFQASSRGGIVQVESRDARVILRGHAVVVMRGELIV